MSRLEMIRPAALLGPKERALSTESSGRQILERSGEGAQSHPRGGFWTCPRTKLKSVSKLRSQDMRTRTLPDADRDTMRGSSRRMTLTFANGGITSWCYLFAPSPSPSAPERYAVIGCVTPPFPPPSLHQLGEVCCDWLLGYPSPSPPPLRGVLEVVIDPIAGYGCPIPLCRDACLLAWFPSRVGVRCSPRDAISTPTLPRTCGPTPGSYGIRKVLPCKSAIGSEACRVGLINCDPVAKPFLFPAVGNMIRWPRPNGKVTRACSYRAEPRVTSQQEGVFIGWRRAPQANEELACSQQARLARETSPQSTPEYRTETIRLTLSVKTCIYVQAVHDILPTKMLSYHHTIMFPYRRIGERRIVVNRFELTDDERVQRMAVRPVLAEKTVFNAVTRRLFVRSQRDRSISFFWCVELHCYADWLARVSAVCCCLFTSGYHLVTAFADLICAVQDHDGNTARLARRSDEPLGVRVSVARIAPWLLDLVRAGSLSSLTMHCVRWSDINRALEAVNWSLTRLRLAILKDVLTGVVFTRYREVGSTQARLDDRSSPGVEPWTARLAALATAMTSRAAFWWGRNKMAESRPRSRHLYLADTIPLAVCHNYRRHGRLASNSRFDLATLSQVMLTAQRSTAPDYTTLRSVGSPSAGGPALPTCALVGQAGLPTWQPGRALSTSPRSAIHAAHARLDKSRCATCGDASRFENVTADSNPEGLDLRPVAHQPTASWEVGISEEKYRFSKVDASFSLGLRGSLQEFRGSSTGEMCCIERCYPPSTHCSGSEGGSMTWAEEQPVTRYSPLSSSLCRAVLPGLIFKTFVVNFIRKRGYGDLAISLLASHQGDPGSMPGRITLDYRMLRIVSEDAVGLRFFSGISRFPPPFHSDAAQYSPQSPSSAPKTSLLIASVDKTINQEICRQMGRRGNTGAGSFSGIAPTFFFYFAVPPSILRKFRDPEFDVRDQQASMRAEQTGRIASGQSVAVLHWQFLYFDLDQENQLTCNTVSEIRLDFTSCGNRSFFRNSAMFSSDACFDDVSPSRSHRGRGSCKGDFGPRRKCLVASTGTALANSWKAVAVATWF
ncbi:hypothetical protein PR048_024418 [Dryococelus australis]|uniref:Uncharacterized protein n=1 Tax=Dryococelus australis TaxID=614101 RepID=A0ABQ9GNI3_9NEOP|nr:hypothetical protein PR048_024418 [Dryococelus australis]